MKRLRLLKSLGLVPWVDDRGHFRVNWARGLADASEATN